MRDRGCTY